MYSFKHTNHGIHLVFLFQNHDQLFLRACNLRQKHLPYLSGVTVKILIVSKNKYLKFIKQKLFEYIYSLSVLI